MSEDLIEIYYLVNGRAINLQFADGSTRTLAPMALVPRHYAEKLLTKQITFGGCCGRPSRTAHLFATKAQLDGKERDWITP